MGKFKDENAFYERMRTLAKIETVTPTTPNRLGTLVDYKRADNGIAYGIVKENHNFYIKKGNINENLGVEDFTYINGLANITNYQYKSFGEADKNRNYLLMSINESLNLKLDNTSTKLILNEDKAEVEIEKAEKKLPDLETATAKKEEPVDIEEPAEEPIVQEPVNDMPVDDIGDDSVEDMSLDEPLDEPLDGEGSDNSDVDDSDGDEVSADEPTLVMKDIEKYLGKATNLIRDIELEPTKVKSYINTYLSAFKDKLPSVDVEDRKSMADKILKIVPDEDLDDLGDSLEDETNENACEDCNSFTQHLESRGYDNISIHECDDNSMTEMISSYANSYIDGENDGSFNEVALFTNENILESLRNDYGHDEYADELMEYVNQLSESTDEDRMTQINELSWSGIKGAFGKVGSDIKKGAQDMYGRAKGAVEKGVDTVKQYAKDVATSYYSAETDALVKKLEKFGEELKPLIQKIDTKAGKAGRNSINLQSMFQRMMHQIRQNKPISLAGINEDSDPAYVETMPNMNEIDDIENQSPEPIGTNDVVDFNEPADIPVDGVDSSLTVDVDGSNKTINIQMSESEKRLKNYVIERLDIITGKKKVKIDESKKPDNLKKLDKLIESEYNTINEDINKRKKEEKLRNYIKEHLDIVTGKKKIKIDESKKSDNLKKLDKLIEEQYNYYITELNKK